jgi:hypothetical protein
VSFDLVVVPLREVLHTEQVSESITRRESRVWLAICTMERKCM